MSDRRKSVINSITAYGIFLIVVFLFQTTLAFRLDIQGIRPSMLVAAVVAAGFFMDAPHSMIFGFILGYLCDILAGQYMGIYSLPLLALGFLCGQFSSVYFRRNLLSVLTCYLYAYLLVMAVYTVGVSLVFNSIDKGFYVLKSLFFEGIYSVIFVPPMYFLLRRVDRLLNTED